MSDYLPKPVRTIIDLQAEDAALWFGNDIEYVRHHLRKLHSAIERADVGWQQTGWLEVEEVQEERSDEAAEGRWLARRAR